MTATFTKTGTIFCPGIVVAVSEGVRVIREVRWLDIVGPVYAVSERTQRFVAHGQRTQ